MYSLTLLVQPPHDLRMISRHHRVGGHVLGYNRACRDERARPYSYPRQNSDPRSNEHADSYGHGFVRKPRHTLRGRPKLVSACYNDEVVADAHPLTDMHRRVQLAKAGRIYVCMFAY